MLNFSNNVSIKYEFFNIMSVYCVVGVRARDGCLLVNGKYSDLDGKLNW